METQIKIDLENWCFLFFSDDKEQPTMRPFNSLNEARQYIEKHHLELSDAMRQVFYGNNYE